MELTYPPEAESFRAETRRWLEGNLPAGWFEDGFELSGHEREQFNKEWPRQLHDGGWICASWNYPVSPLQAGFFFSRSETTWGGTAEIQRNIVGERVLGLPREPSVDDAER